MNTLTLLYPDKCMLCGQRIAEPQRGLCPDCRARLEQQLRTVHTPAPPNLDALVCAAWYAGRVRRALLDYKFNHHYAYGRPLAELLAQAWEVRRMSAPDVITCVPVSLTHVYGRGFNQSAELAACLAAHWELPFVQTLRRRLLARRQSALNRTDRWHNARRTFFPRATADVEGKTVLLVDDIVTTGATVSTCAGILREMGATRVWALAAAKTGQAPRDAGAE